MKTRVLPPAVAEKLKSELNSNFLSIAAALEKKELLSAISLLFDLHKIVRSLSPYIGKGKRLVTQKIIWDFSWHDASKLINDEIPELAKNQYKINLENGAILGEALQLCYSKAAAQDPELDNNPQLKLLITALTPPNTMFKLFADITNSDFFSREVNFDEVERLAKRLDVVSIYNRQQSWFGGVNFFKPVEIVQDAYLNYGASVIARMRRGMAS